MDNLLEALARRSPLATFGRVNSASDGTVSLSGLSADGNPTDATASSLSGGVMSGAGALVLIPNGDINQALVIDTTAWNIPPI